MFREATNEARYDLKRWGIENVGVRATSSGALIRFSYRVVDAKKTKILNDKRVKPYLVDEKNGLALPVPTLGNVGQLQGEERVQGRDTYRLKLTVRGSQVRRLCVDTHLFGDENRGGPPTHGW